MKNVVPRLTSLSTRIVPWCISITSLTIFVPRPVPPGFLLMARELKRLSRTSAGMPRPVSATIMETLCWSDAVSPRIVTLPPRRTSGIALLTIQSRETGDQQQPFSVGLQFRHPEGFGLSVALLRPGLQEGMTAYIGIGINFY